MTHRLAYVGAAALLLAVLTLWTDRARGVEMPEGLPALAYAHAPQLVEEIDRYWPNHPQRAWLGAQVEQESCLSLRHSRCWSPRSEFRPKSGREYGFGLSQFTVAYRKDGSERFNAWREIRDQYKTDLSGWTWENRHDAIYQLRAMVLKMQANAARFTDAAGASNQHAMAQAAYNGGLGSVLKDRALCARTDGCDPALWWGHVETHSTKSRKPLYGSRSAYDINREYPRAIQCERVARYLWMDV